MTRHYVSFRRGMGEPTGPRRRTNSQMLSDGLTRAEQIKALAAMAPEERKPLIRLPELTFLDPANFYPWEKQSPNRRGLK